MLIKFWFIYNVLILLIVYQQVEASLISNNDDLAVAETAVAKKGIVGANALKGKENLLQLQSI